MKTDKLAYFFGSAFKTLTGKGRKCPYCGGLASDRVDRKWLVTTLRRCRFCRLLFRAPASTVGENARLYRKRYREGFTTRMPAEAELSALLKSGFRGHEKDYGPYLRVLEALGAPSGGRLVDFGCSWGYGSYQLRAAGYRVEAYEISPSRARYAREKLGLQVRPEPDFPPGSYDIFFSAHVIEHVQSVSEMLAAGLAALKRGGIFLAFTPNADIARGDRRGRHRMWGYVHPQVLDGEFLRAFPSPALLAASSPYDADFLRAWDGRSRKFGRLDGPELLLALRKP